jgi:hypothetical protein
VWAVAVFLRSHAVGEECIAAAMSVASSEREAEHSATVEQYESQ